MCWASRFAIWTDSGMLFKWYWNTITIESRSKNKKIGSTTWNVVICTDNRLQSRQYYIYLFFIFFIYIQMKTKQWAQNCPKVNINFNWWNRIHSISFQQYDHEKQERSLFQFRTVLCKEIQLTSSQIPTICANIHF